VVYNNVVYCLNVVVGWRSGVRRCGLCVRCEGCCSSDIPHTEHIVKDSEINKIVIVESGWSFILFTYIDDARSNTDQIKSNQLLNPVKTQQCIKFTVQLHVSTGRGHHQVGHKTRKKNMYTTVLGLGYQCLTCVIT